MELSTEAVIGRIDDRPETPWVSKGGILRPLPITGWILMLWIAALSPLHADSTLTPANLAVAASFRALWPDLMAAYTSDTDGPSPRVSFGSSGLLSTQIRHGAPFELYLSADKATVERVTNTRSTKIRTALLANGTLSMVSVPGSTPNARSASVSSLAQALHSGQPIKLALPNPKHAPYGIAAQQLLTRAGLWPLPSGSVLLAENAAQTLQFALSGAVDFALVPTTLIHAAPDSLNTALIDATQYAPVEHHLALLKPDSDAARSLFDWLQGASARQVLIRFGLSPP